MVFDLDHLLYPINASDFFASFWEARPTHIKRSDPSHFDGLVTISDIDRVLACTHSAHPEIEIACADSNVQQEGVFGPGDYLDAGKASAFFDTGGTLIFTGLHRHHPALGFLCFEMERVFHHRFQTNVYLTPPNAQGFRTHYDTHDVFILQTSGSKRWRIYDAPAILPTEKMPFDPNDFHVGEVLEEFTLEAGDTAYIPRGWAHDALALDEVSLHVTLGIMATTWEDAVLGAIRRAATRYAVLRRAVPPGFMGLETPVIKKDIDQLRILFNEAGFWKSIVPETFDNFVSQTPTRSAGVFSARIANTTLSSSTYRRPSGIHLHLWEDAGHLVVTSYGRRVRFPNSFSDIVRHALSGEEFSREEILTKVDEQGTTTLISRLLREGLIVPITRDSRKTGERS